MNIFKRYKLARKYCNRRSAFIIAKRKDWRQLGLYNRGKDYRA